MAGYTQRIYDSICTERLPYAVLSLWHTQYSIGYMALEKIICSGNFWSSLRFLMWLWGISRILENHYDDDVGENDAFLHFWAFVRVGWKTC